jgi:peptidyl-prolyl cis-trans isomerase D
MLHSELTKLYIGRGVQKSIYKFTRQLSNLSYEADLEEVANKMDLELQTSEFFTKDTKKYDVKFVASAYSAGVLNKDENSDLIELSKDKFMVLRINKKIAQRQKIFNEVESEIYKYLSTLLTKTFIDNITSKITTSLNDGNTDIAQKLIDKYQLKWKNVGWVKRDSKQENIGIINSVFALPKPNNSTTYGTQNVNEQQSVVLKLLAIKVPRSTSDSMLSSVILGFESEELLSSILRTLHKKTNIEIFVDRL